MPASTSGTIFFAAHRVIEAAVEAEVRERIGIGIGQFDVLSTIDQAPDKQLRMADIADRMCISRSGVTQSVDRLESLGFVARVAHPQDRRTVLAEITPAGRAVVPEGREALEAVAARYLGGHQSSEDRSSLAAALSRIVVSSQSGGGPADLGVATAAGETDAEIGGPGRSASTTEVATTSG